MPQNEPLKEYEALVKSGALQLDEAQAVAVQSLQRLYDEVMHARSKRPQNFFQRLTGFGSIQKDAPQGIYMYGGVGRGKSMLMDLFYEALPQDMRKKRTHFHQFMIDVHDYINTRRDSDGGREGVDATLPLLAERIAEKSRVLCFDEFHVTDVADAMILGRLFTALFDRGVIVVATSNWPPDKLYEGGLQRERFLPFIALLKKRLEIVHLDSPVDYRAQTLAREGRYFFPLNDQSRAAMDRVFKKLTNNAPPEQDIIEVKGREIIVPQMAHGIARFTFAQLCEQPLGAEDFIAIAKTYTTIFIENIPKMGYDRRNEVMRLMKLIDALYEARCHVVISADAPPDKLYYGRDHAFEFERTISRLKEMQSETYKR
ncbi:MAG: cell division protein ZapE [Alphaproteobacteria bacterium]